MIWGKIKTRRYSIIVVKKNEYYYFDLHSHEMWRCSNKLVYSIEQNHNL
jgi:hypothetical protein